MAIGQIDKVSIAWIRKLQFYCGAAAAGTVKTNEHRMKTFLLGCPQCSRRVPSPAIIARCSLQDWRCTAKPCLNDLLCFPNDPCVCATCKSEYWLDTSSGRTPPNNYRAR